MAYRHDVFISYKRQEVWTPWTRDHFKKLLNVYLQQELGWEPDIFVDERLAVGGDWVDGLAGHLAASRVLVAIFSGDYFGSDWCLHELDLMLARADAVAGGPAGRAPLIIPVVVHDGERIPPKAKRIQPADLSRFRIAYINKDTTLYQEFSQAMAQLAPHVAAAIQAAPAFDDRWVGDCQQRFNQVYEAECQNTWLEPETFQAQRPAPPNAPPKLILNPCPYPPR
jgi:hypothetical protein